jgi:hypothetical protein
MEYLTNESLHEVTNEAMDLLIDIMKRLPLDEDEEYQLSPLEIKRVLRERLKTMLLELAIYMHPRKSLKEIQIIRERELVLESEPVATPPLSRTPSPPLPTVTVELDMTPPVIFTKSLASSPLVLPPMYPIKRPIVRPLHSYTPPDQVLVFETRERPSPPVRPLQKKSMASKITSVHCTC